MRAFQNAIYNPIGKAILFEIIGKGICGRIIQIEPAAGCADPQAILAVFVDRQNGIVADGTLVLRVEAIARESPGLRVELVQAAVEGAHPEVAIMIFKNVIDGDAAQAVGVAYTRGIVRKLSRAAIQMIQSALRPYPNIILTVYENFINVVRT